jgi:hypothetical protein
MLSSLVASAAALGTGLDIAGRPSPEVGVDAAITGAAAVCEGRQVIGSTDPG